MRQRQAHPHSRTRPGRRERVRVRSSPTRRAAHLAPPRPRWTVAASYSSGTASTRIPSSPVSPWLSPLLCPGLGRERVGWATRGLLAAWRRGEMRVHRGEVRAGRCSRRGHHRRCRRHPGSRTAPAALPARWFCVAGAPGSSCRRRALRRPGQPARKEGGAAGPGRRVGACVGAPGVPREQAWEGAQRCGRSWGSLSGNPESRPTAFHWSLSRFPRPTHARSSGSGFSYVPNPERRSHCPPWRGLHPARLPLRSPHQLFPVPAP